MSGVMTEQIEARPGEPARRRSRGEAHPLLVIALSFFTAIIVGGFLITDRMLKMFKSSRGGKS